MQTKHSYRVQYTHSFQMNVRTGKIYEKWDADIEPGAAGAEGKHFGGKLREVGNRFTLRVR